MLLVNTAGYSWTTDEFGGLTVPPDSAVEIEDGYCRAMPARNGTRIPSIIERLAPFLVPADPDLRARWGKDDVTSIPAAPTAAQTADTLVAEGVAPGVAELVATGNVEPSKRSPGRPRKVRE
jgi:hypothetical protein